MQRYLLLTQRIQTYTWQNNIIKNDKKVVFQNLHVEKLPFSKKEQEL